MASIDTAAVLFEDPRGPIERFTWGLFVVRGVEHGETESGRVGAGKDIRIVGDCVSRWRERKGHRLKKSMITGVYDEDIETLVIGTGVEGAVEVPEKVSEAARGHGICQIVVARTPEACRRFNELARAGKRVALLAHGTC